MIKDHQLLTLLNSVNTKLYVGIEHLKEDIELDGDRDGVNDEYELTDLYPIFPREMRSVTPQTWDVNVYTRKDTEVSGVVTSVYTEVEVESVDTITDEETGYLVYAKVTLVTPPEAATADAVCMEFVEEMRPYVNTGHKVASKQDTKEITEVGELVTHTTFGSMTITIDQDLVTVDLEAQKKILFEPYSGAEEIQAGYNAFDMITTPQTIYIRIPYEGEGGEFLGMYFFVGKVVPDSIADIKGGDEAKHSLKYSISTTPRLIMAEA